MRRMLWASSLSLDGSLPRAVREAGNDLSVALSGQPADMVVAFISAEHREGWGEVAGMLRSLFPRAVVIGCSAASVIGAGREVEGAAGVSLTAAVLPEVEIVPIRLEKVSGPNPGPLPGVSPDSSPHFVLLSDPFSFDAEACIAGLDDVYPAERKVGGVASGGRESGGNALILGEETHCSGLVGVALSGNLDLDTIVAQGCRPIGEPMFVTRSRGNILLELDGRRPLEVLYELHQSLDDHSRRLFRHSLFLGVMIEGARKDFSAGDFLVRNLVGADDQSGALVVGGALNGGLVVQFHLRDARASADELDQLLAGYAARGRHPAGSLLFSCLGRGRNLYGRPDHDTDLFRQHLGNGVPLAGFFCNGEIGPVHGRTFLHGYTSSFGLFRAKE